MSDWSWRFALVGVVFGFVVHLVLPRGPSEEVLDIERRFFEGLICERRYFDPSALAFEPPVTFRVRHPEDFKRAWEHPGPTIITLDMWPACYDDGSLREGNFYMRYFEPNGGA